MIQQEEQAGIRPSKLLYVQWWFAAASGAFIGILSYWLGTRRNTMKIGDRS